MTERTPCKATNFEWIAEQNPQIIYAGRDAAAQAGAIVANDILDRVNICLFEDKDEGWYIRVMVDGYTDCEGEEIPPVALDSLLEHYVEATGFLRTDGTAIRNMICILRKHADRLEAELADCPTPPDPL